MVPFKSSQHGRVLVCVCARAPCEEEGVSIMVEGAVAVQTPLVLGGAPWEDPPPLLGLLFPLTA